MWKKELVELLITKYKKHENLYNPHHPSYTDRVKRAKSLYQICHHLKKFEKDMTVEEIKKKIHTLRTQYMREWREFEKSKLSSSADTDVVLEPKLWCFYHLDFLKSHSSTRKSTLNNTHLKEEKGNIDSIEEHTSDNKIERNTESTRQKEISNEQANCDGQSNDDFNSYNENFEMDLPEGVNKLEAKRLYNWKREHVYILIDMFEKHPSLYNPSHKDYGKMGTRKLEFYKLLKEVRKIDRKITMDVMKEKLRTLRNQFLNEVRLLKRAHKNNEIYIPKCWCFQRMSKLYKGIIDITPFYDNNEFDENELSSKNEMVDDSVDDEFEDFFKIPNENEEKYEIETIDIESTNISHNNEDLECNVINESGNTNEEDADVFQPSKKVRSNNTNLENKFNNCRKEIHKLSSSESVIKHEKSKNSINEEDINHNWLGDLVLSEMGEIATKYHNDFAWDVQCLIRKYVLKSKTNVDEITISQSSEPPKDQRKGNSSHNLVLSKASNISFNISFV